MHRLVAQETPMSLPHSAPALTVLSVQASTKEEPLSKLHRPSERNAQPLSSQDILGHAIAQ